MQTQHLQTHDAMTEFTGTLTVLAGASDSAAMRELALRAAPAGAIVRRVPWPSPEISPPAASGISRQFSAEVAIVCFDGVVDVAATCTQLRSQGVDAIVGISKAPTPEDRIRVLDGGADKYLPLRPEHQETRFGIRHVVLRGKPQITER